MGKLLKLNFRTKFIRDLCRFNLCKNSFFLSHCRLNCSATIIGVGYVISKNWHKPKVKPPYQVKLVQIYDSRRLIVDVPFIQQSVLTRSLLNTIHNYLLKGHKVPTQHTINYTTPLLS